VRTITAAFELTQDALDTYFPRPEETQDELVARVTGGHTPVDTAIEAVRKFHELHGPGPCVLTPGADILKAGAGEFAKWRAEDEENPRETQSYIREVCDEIRDFLIEKNEQYGDSAINPVRIFSRANPDEQLLIRIDDKLSRLARGDDRLESDEDVLDDLIGYLILYKVTRRRAQS
jgi:hypothetical protein